MNKDEIKEKLRTGLDKVVESSKVAFTKAGTAVQKFSDNSVTHIEIKQYESKRNEQLKKLGEIAIEKFKDDDSAVLSASEEQVVAIRNLIKEYGSEIEKRRKILEEQSKSQGK